MTTLTKKIDQPFGRVLGIDYGARRIGLALSDENRIFGSTLHTIHRRQMNDLLVVNEIEQLINEHQVRELVIGWPLRLNGKEGIQTQKVAKFIQLLESINLPIHKWDERLSTLSAERVLREVKVKGQAKKDKVDQIAATVILQSWLDAQVSTCSH